MRLACQLALLLSLVISGRAFAADSPRPDILLIMPDQMRGDCLSAVGHPTVRTPQLDALARQGALFRRAYSTVPSCIPARFVLLTGLFPDTSGVVGFKGKPIAYPTMPGLLHKAGYATPLVGRTMHQVVSDEQCGYDRCIAGSTYIAGDDYDTYLRAAAPECGGIRKLVVNSGLTFNGWEAAPWPLADELHPTAWTVRQARAAISAAPVRQPLFLTVSFYAPHSPLFPPKKYFDACLRGKLPLPARGDWVAWKSLPSSKSGKELHRVRLEGEALRRAQAGYFGQIEQIDEQIASLIAEFRARSEKAGRPWLIVFTSDHGEMLGDHGYYRKCEPYEGAANIPFIVAGSPQLGFHAGLRPMQPVCLEDILPTLLELAGAAKPKLMDGASLVPALRGEDRPVRAVLHSEHAPCYGKEQAFQALTDGHWKYIWRPDNGREQLFDLDKDPREEHDLASDPSQATNVKRWRERLIQRLAGRPEGFTDGTRLIPGRPYPPLQAGKP